MTIGNSTYIITQIPLSFVPSSLNVHPPPHSRGPSGRNVATSYVHTAVTRMVVSQLHAPPIFSGGNAHTYRGHIPTFRMDILTSGAYVPTYGVSHGTSHTMTYGPYYGTQYGQGSSPYGGGYQQPAYSPNYGFVAPSSQGPPHYGSSMPPCTGHMGGGNYGQGHGGNQTYTNQTYQGAVH